MRVRADQAFSANYEHHLYAHDEGQIIDGDHGTYLFETGAPVTEVDGARPVRPAVSAPKDAWVEHATALGVEDAHELTKADLIDLTKAE